MYFFTAASLRGFRAFIAVSFVGGMAGLGNAFAGSDPHDTNWTNGAKDSNWATAGNWSDNAVPDEGAQVHISGNSTAAAPIKFVSGGGLRALNVDAGYLELTAGSLPVSISGSIGNSADTAQVTIDSGATLGRSDAALDIGTMEKGTGIVDLHGGTLTGVITVGTNAGATAIVKGFGTVSGINQGSTFTLKGQIIASGGVLTLTNVSAQMATAQNTALNAGWYAVSGGKVVTPDSSASDTPLPVGPSGDGMWVWGNSAADASGLTMVNSVAIRYKVADASLAHGMAVSLLANDNPAAHPAPAGTKFIGYWNIAPAAQVSTDISLISLNFRYDDALAQGKDPVLYAWNGTAWAKLNTKITKAAFIAYYAGSDALQWGDYALGLPAASNP